METHIPKYIQTLKVWMIFALKLARKGTGPTVLSLPRPLKRAIVIILDINLCILTVWVAYYLRLGYFVALKGDILAPALVSVLLAMPIFLLFGMYRVVFRYVGLSTISVVSKATILYGIIYFTCYTVISVSGIPRTIGVIQPILLFLFILLSRVMAFFWLSIDENAASQDNHERHAIIYGTGEAGRQLAAALQQNTALKVHGFFDESPDMIGRFLDGYQVFSFHELENLKIRFGLTELFLAPSPQVQQTKKSIISRSHACGLSVRILPSLSDLADGNIEVSDLKKVEIEDLLGRDPVTPDTNLMSRDITGMKVMVTGAGGSIGSELSRQILLQNPNQLILVELNEYALYSIQSELEETQNNKTEIVSVLMSTTDSRGIAHVISQHLPDTLFHAAAYKHVPMLEKNILEGIRNNIFGTLNVVKAAILADVNKFILVSTDKAVRPTNVMGASKRIAELIVQSHALDKHTTKEQICILSTVRFGNVLGSSGSVIPRFRKQIKSGGPVTVTHEEITRYFMTITEASQLVVQAGAMAQGGDVFLLDMGEPVRILDMAKKMIELSGLSLQSDERDGDIEIKITGIRPGEKLYEELLLDDSSTNTAHPRIMRGCEKMIEKETLLLALEQLSNAIDNRDEKIALEIISQLVPEYIRHDVLNQRITIKP